MKVTFINSNDKWGQRFSGIDWFEELNIRGWDSHMLVGHSPTSSDSRISQTSRFNKKSVIAIIRALEIYNASQNKYSPFSRFTYLNKYIRQTDLVHFQVMHDLGWFRLEDIYRLASRKPSVWTWHDAWNVTGHCLQPLDCNHFEKNCFECPHLEWDLPIARDRANKEKLRKASLVRKSKISVHVSTNWMERLVRSSPGFEEVPVTVIPFGIDTSKFRKFEKKDTRKKLGIQEDDFVIGFRSSEWNVKNLKLILEALPHIKSEKRNLVIINVDLLGQMDFKFQQLKMFRIIELGWVDSEKLIDFYTCLDVFLGVSIGESFGFMPLEAYACGVPVIALKYTAVAEMVKKVSPKYVISNSPAELIEAIENLIGLTNSEQVNLSNEVLQVVGKEYNLPLFISKMTSLYESTILEWNKNE